MRVTEFERRLWLLDQKINDRGFRVDTVLAKKAARACLKEKEFLDSEVHRISLGSIDSATQVAKLKQLLSSYGVKLDNLRATTIEEALKDGSLEAEAKTLLQARQRVSKSSTAKFETALVAVGPDKRLRGGLQFAGASRTSRWAGRLFQPHNLPRPTRKWPEVKTCIEALQNGTADLLTDNVHQLCSDVARSIIVADKGKKLLVADYSAIEGRVLAWLAGEKWKIKAYERGDDLYVVTFNRMFGQPETTKIDSDERQQGKCFELAMGYEGGVKALLDSAETYGVDIEALAAATWKVASRNVKSLAEKLYGYAMKRRDPTAREIGKKLYIQLECAKIMWRSIAPETVRLWKLYKEAAVAAIRHPGRKYKAGRCVFQCTNIPNILAIRLPSGRLILYSDPKLHERKRKSGKIDTEISYTGKYGLKDKLYGGKIAENVDQAIARDVLGFAMLRVDKHEYPIVLTVHDEVIAEVDRGDTKLTLDRMIKIMVSKPAWAEGLPLTAEGYEAIRYRKD